MIRRPQRSAPRKCIALVIAYAFFGTFSEPAADAGVLNADWQAPGDGKAILDTSTNRLWLDLTQTGGLTTAFVTSQLAPGGQFQSWRYATQSEAHELLVSAGIPLPDGWHPENFASVGQLLDIWGDLKSPTNTQFSRGSYFATQPNGTSYVAGALAIGSESFMPGEGFASEWGMVDIDENFGPHPEHGHALISLTAVPEPSSLVLLSFGAVGLVAVAVRRYRCVPPTR